ITEFDLAANTHYVLGRPYIGGIIFKYFANEADLQDALTNHRIMSAYGVPATGAIEAPYSRVFGVFFNANQTPVFAHEEVREALSIAIDRYAIVDRVLGGSATPLMGPVPPGSGVPPLPIPTTATRIADATKVLTDAGWKYDGDAREWKLAKTGEALTVT